MPEESVKQRRRGRTQPKGRQVEPEALAEVQALLGDAPREREFLIEYLHLIQGRFGHLSARHLAALAEEMRLAMAEVWEVATFYAHLDTVKEGEDPPPALTLRVCDSLSCELAGAPALLESLRSAFPGGAGRHGALHGPLRLRAGRRGRAPACGPGDARERARSRLGRGGRMLFRRRRKATTRSSAPASKAGGAARR